MSSSANPTIALGAECIVRLISRGIGDSVSGSIPFMHGNSCATFSQEGIATILWKKGFTLALQPLLLLVEIGSLSLLVLLLDAAEPLLLATDTIKRYFV
ncbi:hypothetical protein BDV26DRAFT_262408 [Aspergillus bertholletiae]|uniref:Uncharacterized protein n=1 Tax=Aspergillus bertholletiae TaxID=1226010 RepID=A0A5N7B8I2_9EURO|nr:hypothetical protein BDV26DRAFT_262408 [Aspergillus bertholletiae]